LFYRLNVLPVEMPPLRSRLEDVPALVEHFARRLAAPGNSPVRMGDDVAHLFQCYEWPGNIRELSNLIDRLTVLFPGSRLSLDSVPSSMLPRGMRVFANQMVQMRADQSPSIEPREHVDVQDTGSENDLDLLLDPASDATRPTNGLQMATIEAPDVTIGVTVPEGVKSVEEIVMMVEDGVNTAPGSVLDLPNDGLHLKDHLAEIEKSLIVQALNRSDGNISQTARLLRLQRTTLIEKINKYGLRAE